MSDLDLDAVSATLGHMAMSRGARTIVDDLLAEIEDLRRQLSNARNVGDALATAVWPDDRVKAAHDTAMKLLDYVYILRAHGERAPGGNENWREFDRRLVAFLQASVGAEESA